MEFDAIARSIFPRNISPHNDFAGKYNPSYVLLKSNDGHVYAKYVVLHMVMIITLLFGFLRPL